MTLTLSMRLQTGANWLKATPNFSIDYLLIRPYIALHAGAFAQHPVISGSLRNCINHRSFWIVFEKNSGRKSHPRWRLSFSRSSAFKVFFSHTKKKTGFLKFLRFTELSSWFVGKEWDLQGRSRCLWRRRHQPARGVWGHAPPGNFEKWK